MSSSVPIPAIQLAGVKFSQQASLVLLSMLALSLLVLWQQPTRPVLIASIVFLLMGAVQAYGVNCMTVGNCSKFAWFSALVLSVPVIISIYMIVSGKSADDDDAGAPLVSMARSSPCSCAGGGGVCKCNGA